MKDSWKKMKLFGSWYNCTLREYFIQANKNKKESNTYQIYENLFQNIHDLNEIQALQNNYIILQEKNLVIDNFKKIIYQQFLHCIHQYHYKRNLRQYFVLQLAIIFINDMELKNLHLSYRYLQLDSPFYKLVEFTKMMSWIINYKV